MAPIPFYTESLLSIDKKTARNALEAAKVCSDPNFKVSLTNKHERSACSECMLLQGQGLSCPDPKGREERDNHSSRLNP